MSKTEEIRDKYVELRATYSVRESIKRTAKTLGKPVSEVCEELGFSEEDLFYKFSNI